MNLLDETVYSLPAIVIRNDFLLPNIPKQFTISRKISIASIAAFDKNEKQFIFLFQKNDAENPVDAELYETGILVEVLKVIPNLQPINKQEINWLVDVKGLNFITVVSTEVRKNLNDQDYIHCDFRLKDPIVVGNSEEVFNYIQLIKNICQKYVDIAYIKQDMCNEICNADNLQFVLICYHLVNMILKTNKDVMGLALDVLNSDDDLSVLKTTYDILSKELASCEIRNVTTRKIQEETYNFNRQAILIQQLKHIEAQLNESSENNCTLLEQTLKEKLPEELYKNDIEQELNKLKRLTNLSPDYHTVKTYLEVLSELPWKDSSVDSYNLKKAKKILDADHYGLEKVKDRIIEFIAVKAFAPLAKSPILCFVGPPGVGKTSLGQSVARTLDRKFERISLGGLHDEAELRGHRRTYIGALPGKIIQALRKCGTNNPVILLDEIDKIGNGYKGDPSAALLEILDPEQNKSFRDNYLGVDFDLSKVLFICTGNSEDTIAAPLLDRMEVMNLSSYTETEKVFISQKHLIPKKLKEIDLDPKYAEFSEEVIRYIIFNYAPEAGVRTLEKLIDKIIRKLVVKLSECDFNKKIIKDKKITEITTSNIRSFLGVEHPFDGNKREELKVGNSVGLAWSRVGGSVLYVEATKVGGKELLTTGSIGNSMSESTKIALSYIKSNSKRYMIDSSEVGDGIHIHFPEGAIPKDGPSAGIAITTALYSLFTGRIMRKDTAMTGEITLSGLVLPIGGLKEKSIAAMKAGLKRVIIPKANEPDLSEFPDELLNNIEFLGVSNIDQVLENAFDDFPSPTNLVNNLGLYSNALTNLHN